MNSTKNRSIEIILTGIVAIASLNYNIALAQESDDPLQAFTKVPCEGATEVSYRSQKLQSPDNQKTVYFEVVLRRIVPENSLDNPDYCRSNIQTPRLEMVIEEQNNSRRIDYGEVDEIHTVINPISFSPDSRFVITQNDYIYQGGDSGYSNFILDLTVAKPELFSIVPCNENYSKYSGFLSDTEVIFSCSVYGDPETWLETINLDTLAANRLNQVPTNTAKLTRTYGDVIEELAVTKTQVFP